MDSNNLRSCLEGLVSQDLNVSNQSRSILLEVLITLKNTSLCWSLTTHNFLTTRQIQMMDFYINY